MYTANRIQYPILPTSNFFKNHNDIQSFLELFDLLWPTYLSGLFGDISRLKSTNNCQRKMLSRENLAHLLTAHHSVLFVSGSSKATRNSNNQFAVEIANEFREDTLIVDVLKDYELFTQLLDYSPWRTLPQLFVRGQFIGGSLVIEEFFRSGEHKRMVTLSKEKDSRHAPTRRPISAYWRVSGCGDQLVAASADGHMHLLDRDSLEITNKFKLTSGWLNSAATTTDKAYLGDTHGCLHQVDLCGPHDNKIIQDIGAWINDIAVSKNGRNLVFIDGRGDISELEIHSNTLTKLASTGRIGWSICQNHSTGEVAAGLNDGNVIIYDRDGRLSYEARIYTGPVTNIICDEDKYYICGFGQHLSILDRRTNRLEQYAIHRDRIWDIKILGDKAVTSSGDASISVFNIKNKILENSINCKNMPLMLFSTNDKNIIGVFYSNGFMEKLRIG